ALAEPDKTLWADDNDVGVTGFYAHTDGTNKWDEVQIFNCTAVNCNSGISANDTVQLTTDKSWAHDCYVGIVGTCDQMVSTHLKISDETHSISRGLALENIDNSVVNRMRMYLKHPA